MYEVSQFNWSKVEQKRKFKTTGAFVNLPSSSQLFLPKKQRKKSVINLRILLPKLDDYPLGAFSNIRSNYVEAIEKYPKLSKSLNILLNIQRAFMDNKVKIIQLWLNKTAKENSVVIQFESSPEKDEVTVKYLCETFGLIP